MIFPERLKQLRQKKGLTQQEIADLVHVNRVTYTNWEKGKREPSFENLVKLASVLGTSTDYLLGPSDNYIDLEDFETLIKKLPEEILRFKNYSEYRGIKYYIFKSQDEILKAFVGVYWGTTGRANNYYMQQIIEDPEIKKKTRKIEVSMKELLNE